MRGSSGPCSRPPRLHKGGAGQGGWAAGGRSVVGRLEPHERQSRPCREGRANSPGCFKHSGQRVGAALLVVHACVASEGNVRRGAGDVRGARCDAHPPCGGGR